MPNSSHIVTSAHDLSALLDWYEAAGAECALSDDPIDRFEETRTQIEARNNARMHRQNNPEPSASLPHQSGSNPQQSAMQGQYGSPDQASISTFTSKSIGDQSQTGQMPSQLGDMARFNQPNQSNRPQKPASQAPAGAMGSHASPAILEDARQRAQSAKSLEELRQCLEDFEGCSLKYSAKSLVFGEGNPEAPVMFIGEAPGRDEDLTGRPFVGRAGQLLDQMMAAINLDRTNAYITNILPWRPPGNRKPSLDETAMLRPFILRHVELVSPKILVFLGGTSAQIMLESKDGIMRLRGRWKPFQSQDQSIPAMATLHPAYLLRSPAQKRAAWQDLLEVAAKLDALKH